MASGRKDAAAWHRMEVAYIVDPTLGRARLAQVADVGEHLAKRFLVAQRRESQSVTVVSPVASPAPDPRWDRLKETLAPKELDALLASAQGGPRRDAHGIALKPKTATYCRFAVMADTHLGHRQAREDWVLRAFEDMEEEGVEFILHVGDLVEGMSGRPGHVYELSHTGFQAQIGCAADLFALAPVPIKAILGNHDLWFSGKGDAGVDVGAALALRMPGHFECLGYHEADVVVNGIKVKLWHGMDGKAYAKGYRGQKIVETLPGGGKPHILLLGHAHDSAFFVTRNVCVFECGTFSLQSDFMRYTKKEACPGWWSIEVWGEGEIQSIRPWWHPFFLES